MGVARPHWADPRGALRSSGASVGCKVCLIHVLLNSPCAQGADHGRIPLPCTPASKGVMLCSKALRTDVCGEQVIGTLGPLPNRADAVELYPAVDLGGFHQSAGFIAL